jgi:hypothetical protein
MINRTAITNARSSAPARWVVVLFIMVAGVIAYANLLNATFVFDDRERVMTDPSIRALPDIGEVLGATRRPVVNLTLALNYEIAEKQEITGNPSPAVFQLTNLAIHLLTAWAIFALVRRSSELAHDDIGGHDGRHTWIAGATATLWVVHPLTTACVPYIIQRGESLTALFYVLALLTLARSATSPRTAVWLTLSIAATSAGMLTKAVMVTAPIALLCYDRCFIARSFIAALRARWPYYGALALTWALLAVTGVLQGVLSTDRAENATVGFSYAARADGIGPVQYLLSQPDVILHYLRLVIWPTGLAIDYGWEPAVGARMVVTVAIVTLLFLGAVWLFWKKPAVGFVAMMFFIVLGPTSSIVPIRDLAYDHRMYLPLACIITLGILFGWKWLGPVRADRMPTTIFLAPVIIGTIGLAVMTLMRTAQYSQPIALWMDVVTKQPQNPRGWLHVGKYRADSKTPDGYADARAALQRAIQLDPAYAEAYFNLGSVEAQLGNMERAIEYYRTCVELTPEFVQGHSSLAFAYLQSTPRRYEEAIAEFQAALALKPDFDDATRMLAVAHTSRAAEAMNREDFAAAIPDLERALELVPGMPDAIRLLTIARDKINASSGD